MINFLANPERFTRVTQPLRPWLAGLASVFLLWGLYLCFASPEDYQQGDTVRIMYIHVPAAILSLALYAAIGVSSFFGLIFRHALADAAAKALAPIGAVFTGLALATGSLWGKPMWGTWWQWDGRMTSELVLFLLYVSYIALHASIEDEVRAAKSTAILAMVGLVNLPIIHYSVLKWGGNHPVVVTRSGGGGLRHPAMTHALLMGFLAMTLLAALLLWARARLAHSTSRVARIEEEAIATGQIDY